MDVLSDVLKSLRRGRFSEISQRLEAQQRDYAARWLREFPVPFDHRRSSRAIFSTRWRNAASRPIAGWLAQTESTI
jgi:hypothetical protein